MKKTFKISSLFFVCILFCNIKMISQSERQAERLKYLSYVFPSDSLKGFNEIAHSNQALKGGYFGLEYKVFMYRAKRNFINQKYGYSHAPSMDSYNAKGTTPVINAAPCVNEDFEASPVGLVGPTLAGWTISEGSNTSSCGMGGCCPTAGGLDAWVRTTPFVSGALIGTIPNSPLGGTKILQMNDNVTNQGEVVRIQQTFPVTSTNALFQLAYMAEMDGSGHACCDQPYLKLTMLNCTNAPLACPSLSLNAPGPSCASSVPAGWTTNSSGISWTTAWQMYSVDLTPYLGSCVTIQITVGDCDGWAHHGMAFVDMLCSPMTINVNNTAFPVGATSNVTVTACSAGTATVTAPPGLQPYNWTGPAGSGVTNNPNQTFTTTVGGNYTLTMTPPGSCTPIVRIVTLTFGTPPIATFTSANACTTYSFTNTGTGPPAVQTYSFIGAGPPPSFTTTATTTVVNFPPSATYTVVHTVTNAAGCTASVQSVINVPAGPNPAFTIPTPTQCLTGNSYVFTATQATGTHTFGFNPTVGAPPTGNTTPYGPVSFTAPGTYTVTHTITNSGCTTSASSLITVNPMPTVTANNNSPICLGGNVAFTSTGGGTYNWTGPNSFASAVQNPTITGVTAPAAGIYTVSVNLNGCLGTATTQVTISTPTASANNTGPYCAGQTISLIGSAGTSYTWSGPSAFTSNLQSPTIAGATTAMSGTYNFTVNLGGCTATGSTAVTVNPLPVPVAGNTGPYCAGATIQLNVGAFTTYTWTGPSSFSSNAQNPTIPTSSVANAGTYTVSVSDANGCVNTSNTAVVVNPIPTPTIGSNSPICAGGALNLTSTGGGTYSWSGPNSFTSVLQNPTIAATTTLNSGVYSLTVTAAGCSASVSVNVVVSTGTASAANTGPYCAGQTISLSANVGTGYAWTGPGGFTSSVQNPTIPSSTAGMSGVYSVTVSIGTCTAAATTNVLVNALPTPNANSNSPICDGQPLNFTGSAATTYTWTGPNSFVDNSQNPTIPTASTTASGTYTFAVTDANGCTNSVTAIVVVNANPVIVVNNPTVCLNTTINLTSNGGTGYAWSGPLGFTSALQNPSITNAQLNMSGAYTVTVTTAQGCTNTAVANVNVFPLPSPTITSNSPVCVGGQLNLQGSGGATYQWTGPGSFSNSNQNTSISPVTMAANGTYTLLATAGTCTAQTTAVIVINPLPTPNIVTNSPICIGNDINLSATGGTAFVWAGPNSFAGANATETVTAATLVNSGTYTVVVTDANGCINFTTANVVVNPQPVVSATGTTVCENSNAQLTANGGVTYSWSGPGGYTSAVQNPILFNIGQASAGQYTVLVTDANTCTNTAVANIGINPAPTPSINVNTPICMGDIINLTASGGVTYSWIGPNGFVSSVQSPTVLGNSTAVGGIYQVTVTDANTCSATATINTVVNPLPVAQITAGPNVGCAPLCVTFTVQSTPSASLAYWTFGNGEAVNGPLSSISCYNSQGVYTINVTVTDINGCLGTASYTAEVYPKPVADFNHAPIKPIINIDGEVVFTDASWGANIVSWNWYFMNTAQYTSIEQNPTFLYQEPGNYVVALIVKSDHGCIDTILRPLVVGEDYGIYVPNAFTPNEDGFNDTFYPKGFGIVQYELFIFDRWGEKVFHTKEFNDSWNGTYQGRGTKICKEDVYTWLINVTDVFGKSHELKGHVTLIR